MSKNLLLTLFCFILLIVSALGQGQVPVQTYRLIKDEGSIQTKNYYLLTLFQEIEEVRSLLERDPALDKIRRDKLNNLSASLADCQQDVLCYSRGIKFTESEIKLVGDRLSKLYKSTNALGRLVNDHLFPSGVYILFSNSSPAEFLVKAWEQDALGINHAIGVYAEGTKPNYPKIDSISFNVKHKRYSDVVFACTEAVLDESKRSTLFFEPSLNYVLRFLEINHRSEASDFEPMISTVNKSAYERIGKTNWDAFEYTLILVPGAGPDEPQVALSSIGMLRCRIAAQRFFEGMAPFIVVSGGRVHPYKTKYNEAYEMKKYLVEVMNVPEEAIIMEPHARHTTTNMRNTARLIFRYGMPFDKPCISSTSRSQSFYITDKLASRCQKELMHIPFKNGKRLSSTEAEFYPVLDALHANPLEPLDP
ncbi:MAG TPA: YdcF family protein [Chryseosolibacter sp.]